MSSFLLRFPDGEREYRYGRSIAEGDAVLHDGQRYRVVSVSSDARGRAVVTVEPDSESLGDVLRSEEGALHIPGEEDPG